MAQAADQGLDPHSVLTEAEKNLVVQPTVKQQPPDGEAVPEQQGEASGSAEAESSGTESTPEGEQQPAQQTEQQTPAPSPESQQAPPDGEKPLTRKEKKAQALEKSWQNADRRHKEAADRETQLDQRAQQLEQLAATLNQRAQELDRVAPDDPMPKYSPDEIATTLAEFLDEGDLDSAKQLASTLAGKANANKAMRDEGPNSPQFQQAYEANRVKLIRENADLNDPQSDLFKESTALMTGDWAPLLQAHPGGITAAVEVAKLRLAAASVPQLEAEVERLETELAELKKNTQLDPTGQVSREAAPPQRNLTPEQEIEILLRQARQQERV